MHAIAGRATGHSGLGETVTWLTRHFGLWFTMTSESTGLERPSRFVDQQLRGPFKTFVDEHLFDTVHEGSQMTDNAIVASPLLGVVSERLALLPCLHD